MILRKPYALLIKYFQKINILLLLLVGFVFYQNLQIHQFVKDYLETSIYNPTLDSINNYANIYVYLAFIVIMVISVILIYLLHYKDKPYASYIYILVANFITFAFFLYTDNYFTYQVIEGYNLVAIKVVKDLLFISTLPYYPMIFILLIRSIGIDLKSFGFQEDKEFVEINEADREEVEVQVGFDKDRFLRKIKYYFRHFKYFFLEHKISLLIVFVIVLMLFGFNFYRYFYVENKIYSMNEVFQSNNYRIKVEHTYLTDKDFSGNVVSEEGTYFILVDLKIENLLSDVRNFDIEKMLLFVDDDYYVPTTRFNSYFTDMGNLFTNKSLGAHETTSYLLVYEVPKPRDGANFLLKYQDLSSRDSKLIRVRMKIQDISTFKERGSANLSEDFTIPINLSEKVSFRFSSYEISDSVNYTYQQCSPNSCPIYQGTVNAGNGKKILYIKGSFGESTKQEFLNFVLKYGKIRYRVNGEYQLSEIQYAVNRTYRGNYLYFIVPEEIVNADSIDFVFTIRTYQYFYKLKGE